MSKRKWYRERRRKPRFPTYPNRGQACGMYSETAARAFGTVVWEDGIGREYEITAHIEPHKYGWPDAVIVTREPLTYKRGSLGDGGMRTHGAWGTSGW